MIRPGLTVRRVLLVPAALAMPLGLAACGDNTGGYPPPPPEYTPPDAALDEARDPVFRPLVQALLAQRRASKALADFRASVGPTMTEEDQKRYGELFGKVASAGERVGALYAAADLSPEQAKTWEIIVSLDDAQLESIGG